MVKLTMLSLFSLLFAVSADDVILQPPSGKTGPVASLFFAQGADIKTDQYTTILTSLQEAVPFPLWVGIPQTPFDIAAIPYGLKSGIERVGQAMVDQGMPNTDFQFYGGHSLGGAMIPDYVKDNADTADGMFLLGSFLSRKFKTATTDEGRPQVSYPVPTLTVGGELDGLCRISRIAEALYTQVTFSEDPEAAAEFMPVTVIEGINHFNFASGDIPKFVLNNDLKSETEEEAAHALIVSDVAAFLNTLVDSKDSKSKNILSERVKESTDFVEPIVSALLMEGYERFLPGCYCEDYDEYGFQQYGTCESTPKCNGGSRWSGEHAQGVMAGIGSAPEVEGLTINAVDSIHLVTEERPTCHLPHIHGNDVNNANPGGDDGKTPPLCESPEGCELDITTVTELIYENSGQIDIWRAHFSVPWVDTGYLPITANEMKVKIKSRQAVWQAAGVQNVTFSETDDTSLNRCGEINQAAVDWAMEQLPEKTRERFEKHGQQFVIGDDLSTCKAGPCWIWDALRFEKDDEANTVTIQSVGMPSENKNSYPCGEDKLLPCSAGFHYCKLLSPARALEWMYVDGLKNTLGTNKN